MAKAIEAARSLAAVYGREISGRLVYPQGVAISGRLRLARLDERVADVAAEVGSLVQPVIADASAAFDPRFGLAGLTGAVWAEEMFDATGDDRYSEFLANVVGVFDLESVEPINAPLDHDVRVEDFFFAAALLGRAHRLIGDERHLDVLTRYLRAVDTQQSDGLFWHCHASPYFWGRGNAFAALGFAEALTYLPSEHPARGPLLDRHLAHLRALAHFQDETGMWRQVVDDDATYLEHSATTMITCAVARGVRLGWLGADPWRGVVERAWRGIAERIGMHGELEHVCVGTGPLDDRDGYVTRAYTDGVDDRGGAMALWCAVEVAQAQATLGAPPI